MSEPVAPPTRPAHAFPRPDGDEIPERIFEHDQIVTGEAVSIRIQPASLIQLVGAGIIDLALGFTILIATITLLVYLESYNLQKFPTYQILGLVLGFVIIPAVIETLTNGRSLGKWITGVQILRDDGGAIRFRHAITRSLVGLIELYGTSGALALFSTFANRRHKRLGDLLAGSYPVSLNPARRMSPALIMPSELYSWASIADISRIPPALTWRIRQFLNTSSQLHPAYRAPLGHDLAAEALPFVSPPPPEGTHPERFLAAALIIRRDGEYARESESEVSPVSASVPYGLGEGTDQPTRP